MKPVPIVAFLAVLMGCNAEEVRDWDDDKLLVLGAMYDHFNENHLKAGRTICMTSEQIQAKTGMDSSRVNLLLKHLADSLLKPKRSHSFPTVGTIFVVDPPLLQWPLIWQSSVANIAQYGRG